MRRVLQEFMSHFRRMWNVGRKNIAYAAKWGTLLFVGTALCVDMGISEILGVSITAFGICQLYHARYVLSLFDEYRDALLPYFHMDAKQVERYMMWYRYGVGGARLIGLIAIVGGAFSTIAVRKELLSSLRAITGGQLVSHIAMMIGVIIVLYSGAIIQLTPEGSVWRQRCMLFWFRASGVMVILTGLLMSYLVP
ncbi:MAG: hypothetical protein ACOX38_07020 [Bacillota bacterium]|nr:hypothetical protein [Bacillota bacterium]